MPTEQLDKRECKNHSQAYPDNLNTPSLIRTIPSVLEFHPALKTFLLFKCFKNYSTPGNGNQLFLTETVQNRSDIVTIHGGV